MKFKTVLALIGVMLFGAGIVLAISGATATQVGNQSRWTGGSSGSITTEGGNISATNVASTSLTDRWAAFFGNVSGSIVLGNDTVYVYQWTYDPTAGGEVCLSTNSALNFAGTLAAAVPATLDTDFGLGTAADDAANTFQGSAGAMNFATSSVSGLPTVATTGGFDTAAFTSGGTGAKSNYAFCTAINSAGKNYKNNDAQYQVIVPTTPGSATTESYYFYMEFN